MDLIHLSQTCSKHPDMDFFLIVGVEVSDGKDTDSESDMGLSKKAKEDEEEDKPYVVELDGKGCPNIIISKAEKKRLAKPWKYKLIIKLLSKRIGFSVMKRKIEQSKATSGAVLVVDVGNDFYFVKFRAVDDYEHALTGEPLNYLSSLLWLGCSMSPKGDMWSWV